MGKAPVSAGAGWEGKKVTPHILVRCGLAGRRFWRSCKNGYL